MKAPQITAADGLDLPGCLTRKDALRLGILIMEDIGDALRRGAPVRRIATSLPRAQIGSLAEASGLRPACRPGCAACCHQPVAASPIEVLDLAAYLLATRPPAALAELQAALQAQSRGERARCALLGPGEACSVYARRPLACVRYHSMDAAACYVEGGAHAYCAAQEQVGMSVEAGLILACEAAGLQSTTLQLAAALDRALSDPTIEARWRRGEAVWDGVEVEGDERCDEIRAAFGRRRLPVVHAVPAVPAAAAPRAVPSDTAARGAAGGRP